MKTLILQIIKLLIKYIRKGRAAYNWYWDKYLRRQLKARSFMRLKTVGELEEYVDKVQHPYYQKYVDSAYRGIPIHRSLIDYLELDFKDKKVLDIGPGLGAFLGLAAEGGAKSTEFFDSNPLFWRYLTIRGHKGWVLNYKLFTGFFPFNLLHKRRYDVVLSRGSINGDDFNVLSEKCPHRLLQFPRWIKQVESMVAPGGIVIITPTYRSVNPKWVCTDIDKFRVSHFSKTLLDLGYEILPIIDGYGYKPEWDENVWPFTFYKLCLK